MVKSIAPGILTVIIGLWVGFVLSLLIGLIIDPIAEKKLSELSLRRFRYAWGFAWIGFAVGVLNALSIYFLMLNGIVLLGIFLIYLVFFMRYCQIFSANLCKGFILNGFHHFQLRCLCIF